MPPVTGRNVAILFALVAAILYGPLYNAGFVTDFLGWLECHETTAFWNAYTCFGNRGLYFIPFIVLEALTGSVSLQPLPWFIVWTGLHVLNAWLVYDLCRQILVRSGNEQSTAMPIVAGLIFLVHPWQVEVLAWKACVNYLTCCLAILLTLRYYLMYLTDGRKKNYWISVALFGAGLFTMEFILVLPFVLGMMRWSVDAQRSSRDALWYIVKDILPFALATGMWFIANKMLFGLWIGHYGSETHTNLQPLAMTSVVMKYCVKTFALTRFLNFPQQTNLYAFLDNVIVASLALAGMAWFVLKLLFLRARLTMASRIRITFFLSAITFLIPIANLYFYYLQYSENDRYTYPALVFFSIWMVFLLWQWGAWAGKAIIGLWLACCIVGTITIVRAWEYNTRVYWQHINTFPSLEKERAYLLNVPDNFKGTFMFRNIGGDSAFEEVHRYIGKSSYTGKMYDVFQYNMTSLSNDFIVTQEAEDTVKVEFAQWGNWWWRNGIGGEKYSTEYYTAWPEGKWYYIRFKDPADDAHILYWTKDGWKELK